MKATNNPAAEIAKQEKKGFKRAGTHVGLATLVYITVMSIMGAIGSMFTMIPYFAAMTPEQFSQFSQADLLNYVMNHPAMGVISLIGCLAGLLAVFLLFIKGGTYKTLFKKNKQMTFLKFGGLLCVLYLFSTIGTEFYNIFERELNFFGLSTAAGLEMASGSTSSVIMALFMGIIGPIAEELVFRGFLLRRLEKKGKLLAIVVTSLLFGLMHENLPQVFFATMIGLVMGYIALEYSIIWTIVLHIFNNLVMCELAGFVFGDTSAFGRHVFDLSFIVITAIVGIVVLIKNRHSIVTWIRSNKWSKPELVWTMTGFGMIVSIASMTITTIANIFLLG